MADNTKPIGADTTGFELLTNAIRDLLNEYPGLRDDQVILFEELETDTGIAFSADNGSLIMSENVSVTDHVTQVCQYPFFVIYRTSAKMENQKISVQSFLDNLGEWLSKETIQLNGLDYNLEEYPELTGNRKISKITRMNSYGLEPNADGVQDWLLPVTVQYTKEYDL